MTTETVKKPRVIGIVILSLLGGLLNLVGGIGLLPSAADLAAAGIPTWSIYLSIALGALQILAAILIAMYKRVGLLLGIALYGAALLMNILSAVSGQGIPYVGIIIGLAVIYYLYKYLTSEPEKSFFT